MKNLVITLHLKNSQDAYGIALQIRPNDGVSEAIHTAPKKIQAVFARADEKQVIVKLTDPSQKQAEQMMLELIGQYKSVFINKVTLAAPKDKNDTQKLVTIKEWPKDF